MIMAVPQNWSLILFFAQFFVLVVLIYVVHVVRMRILETILEARAVGAATPKVNRFFVQIERLLDC